jgi:rRNA maturation endonuclease Nob1
VAVAEHLVVSLQIGSDFGELGHLRTALFCFKQSVICSGGTIFFTKPTLVCPACGNSVENFDRFCPMCGAEALRRYQITAAKCDECGRTLGHYKYRNYKIHFCTHCGVLLDRRGV